MATEKEKKLAGELYDCGDAELLERGYKAKELQTEYNNTSPRQKEKLAALLDQLLGQRGEDVWIAAPFFVDYGENIFLEPVFEDGKCVEERYFTEQNYGNYSSADTSEVFELVFRLAGKTSEEDPAVLLQQDGKLYCIAQGTAYVICTDYRTIPETISVGTLVNSERRIVYQVRCDGSFEQVRS